MRQEQAVEECYYLVDARPKLGDRRATDEVTDCRHGVHLAHQSVVVFQ
jgi:hypothetical protein